MVERESEREAKYETRGSQIIITIIIIMIQ